MPEIRVNSGELWRGPPMSMGPATEVVSYYFYSAHSALLRAKASSDSYCVNSERLVALFALLSGFEAFLNCHFRILADGLDNPQRSKIIAIVNARRDGLRERALKLPWQAFGCRSESMDSAIAIIEQYISIRHNFMHIKHDWSGIKIDDNVSIQGLMDTTFMSHDDLWKLLPLFVAVRRYMKATFALGGVTNIPHAVDRWTKPISNWRML